MDWHPGQGLLRRNARGAWTPVPEMLIVPDRSSFITHQEGKKLTRFIKDHGLEEDVRPWVSNKKVQKYKWKRKPKKAKRGGE